MTINAYTIPGIKYKNQFLRNGDLVDVLKCICQFYDEPVNKVDSKSRRRELVFARQVFMYLVATYSKTTLKTIGEFFKCKYDHTTVIHGRQTIKDLMFSDPEIKSQVEYLRTYCGL